MINKELFFQQVDELSKVKNIDRTDFELLHELLVNNSSSVDPGYLADKIVTQLSNDFYSQTMISWEFLQTPIGKALIEAKFGISNDIYFISDLAEIMGCSRQFISKEIKNENIKYEKRGGIIFFREKYVNEYLKKKSVDILDNNKNDKYQTSKESIINGGFEREEKYQ